MVLVAIRSQGFLLVDAARVPDDQGGQQREESRDHPWRVHPILRGQRHGETHGDHDCQGHRPPALTRAAAPSGATGGRAAGFLPDVLPIVTFPGQAIDPQVRSCRGSPLGETASR